MDRRIAFAWFVLWTIVVMAGIGWLIERHRKQGPDTMKKAFWIRVAVIVSVVWIGGLIITSQVARGFEWFPGAYSGDSIGPAMIVAIVGTAVIFALGVGIPWVAETLNKD